jgi:membrane-associated phospholipid phosphatase
MHHKFLEFGLLLSDWKCITAILIIAYLFVDKDRFIIAICLEVFAISFNGYMKTLFKIPLNAKIFSVDDGWAFPSGHTQSLAMILMYICWYYRKSYVISGSTIMFLYAVISIEYFGYHTWIDIIGGFVSALIVFVLFISALKFFKPSVEVSCFVCLVFASLLQIKLSLVSKLSYAHFYYCTAGASSFLCFRLIRSRKQRAITK